MVVPVHVADTWGGDVRDPSTEWTFTIVVQLNCTRPWTPLLSIRTPPVVRSVEMESPPVPAGV